MADNNSSSSPVVDRGGICREEGCVGPSTHLCDNHQRLPGKQPQYGTPQYIDGVTCGQVVVASRRQQTLHASLIPSDADGYPDCSPNMVTARNDPLSSKPITSLTTYVDSLKHAIHCPTPTQRNKVDDCKRCSIDDDVIIDDVVVNASRQTFTISAGLSLTSPLIPGNNISNSGVTKDWIHSSTVDASSNVSSLSDYMRQRLQRAADRRGPHRSQSPSMYLLPPHSSVNDASACRGSPDSCNARESCAASSEDVKRSSNGACEPLSAVDDSREKLQRTTVVCNDNKCDAMRELKRSYRIARCRGIISRDGQHEHQRRQHDGTGDNHTLDECIEGLVESALLTPDCCRSHSSPAISAANIAAKPVSSSSSSSSSSGSINHQRTHRCCSTGGEISSLSSAFSPNSQNRNLVVYATPEPAYLCDGQSETSQSPTADVVNASAGSFVCPASKRNEGFLWPLPTNHGNVDNVNRHAVHATVKDIGRHGEAIGHVHGAHLTLYSLNELLTQKQETRKYSLERFDGDQYEHCTNKQVQLNKDDTDDHVKTCCVSCCNQSPHQTTLSIENDNNDNDDGDDEKPDPKERLHFIQLAPPSLRTFNPQISRRLFLSPLIPVKRLLSVAESHKVATKSVSIQFVASSGVSDNSRTKSISTNNKRVDLESYQASPTFQRQEHDCTVQKTLLVTAASNQAHLLSANHDTAKIPAYSKSASISHRPSETITLDMLLASLKNRGSVKNLIDLYNKDDVAGSCPPSLTGRLLEDPTCRPSFDIKASTVSAVPMSKCSHSITACERRQMFRRGRHPTSPPARIKGKLFATPRQESTGPSCMEQCPSTVERLTHMFTENQLHNNAPPQYSQQTRVDHFLVGEPVKANPAATRSPLSAVVDDIGDLEADSGIDGNFQPISTDYSLKQDQVNDMKTSQLKVHIPSSLTYTAYEENAMLKNSRIEQKPVFRSTLFVDNNSKDKSKFCKDFVKQSLCKGFTGSKLPKQENAIKPSQYQTKSIPTTLVRSPNTWMFGRKSPTTEQKTNTQRSDFISNNNESYGRIQNRNNSGRITNESDGKYIGLFDRLDPVSLNSLFHRKHAAISPIHDQQQHILKGDGSRRKAAQSPKVSFDDGIVAESRRWIERDRALLEAERLGTNVKHGKPPSRGLSQVSLGGPNCEPNRHQTNQRASRFSRWWSQQKNTNNNNNSDLIKRSKSSDSRLHRLASSATHSRTSLTPSGDDGSTTDLEERSKLGAGCGTMSSSLHSDSLRFTSQSNNYDSDDSVCGIPKPLHSFCRSLYQRGSSRGSGYNQRIY